MVQSVVMKRVEKAMRIFELLGRIAQNKILR